MSIRVPPRPHTRRQFILLVPISLGGVLLPATGIAPTPSPCPIAQHDHDVAVSRLQHPLPGQDLRITSLLNQLVTPSRTNPCLNVCLLRYHHLSFPPSCLLGHRPSRLCIYEQMVDVSGYPPLLSSLLCVGCIMPSVVSSPISCVDFIFRRTVFFLRRERERFCDN